MGEHKFNPTVIVLLRLVPRSFQRNVAKFMNMGGHQLDFLLSLLPGRKLILFQRHHRSQLPPTYALQKHKGWNGLKLITNRLRRAGTWDPLLRYLHLDTRLLKQQNTKKLYGTKNSCMHAHLQQIMDNKIQKDQEPNCHFEKLGTKAGYCACPTHTPPPNGWASRLSYPLVQPLEPPYKETAGPPSGSQQGNLLPVFAPSCCSRNPEKSLPELFVWSLISFY